MKKILRLIKGMPLWRLALIELLLVAAIGFVDYLTGDYSILIFYVIPVALAVWFHGELGAIIISAAACCARYMSDYFSYSNSNVNYYNSMNDLLFLLIIGLVLSAVKRLISNDKSDEKVMPATKEAGQSAIYFKNVRGLK
jgi:hypothetical protein